MSSAFSSMMSRGQRERTGTVAGGARERKARRLVLCCVCVSVWVTSLFHVTAHSLFALALPPLLLLFFVSDSFLLSILPSSLSRGESERGELAMSSSNRGKEKSKRAAGSPGFEASLLLEFP